ncbi:MAG: T9SS type A sorting domain-containing protein [Flavobacteriales bacterium]|nr:T9SS type A sorting domain-containing protein [Flavobacteriales bacterium]
MKHFYAFSSVCSRFVSSAIYALIFTTALLLSGTETSAQCNNVTYGGSIGSNQTGNVGYNPSMFLNVTSPSGGSGSLEYMWLYKNSSTDWQFVPVSGASSNTYDCPSINETTTFRRCCRRSGCPTWDGESNDCTVTINCNTCNNLTSGGTIGSNQSGCSGFDPAPFTNVASPAGGSGALEIIWMYWNASTGWNMTQINGATGLTYDAGPIYEDTYFRRCSRRQGCSNYVGESNDIFVEVTPCCDANIDDVVIYNITNGTSTALTNGATYNLSGLPTNWNIEAVVSGTTAESVVFDWSGSYTTDNTQNAVPFRSPDDNTGLNLGSGSYTLIVSLYSQDNGAGMMCDQEIFNFNIESCSIFVNAGEDRQLCGNETITLTATTTGASTCQSGGDSDCNHSLAGQGGWLESPSSSAVCGDNAGTKLWTQSGQGTSYIILDLGADLPAGTQICANMKLEHCSNTGTNYSNAKIQASTALNGTYVSLTNSVTFTQNYYQEFCYTLASSARYIKISDNGNCAFRVDYVEYTTPSINNSGISYMWSGAGIVGANNGPSIQVNQTGVYIVTVTDCNGCTDTDEVIVHNNGCCALDVTAGPDQQLCYPQQVQLTSTVTGASNCQTQGTSDCNHTLAGQGGWLESPSNSAVCGDNAGTKLWTQSGQGTSYIVLDMGVELPAGTQICASMKLEHCNNSNTNYSNAKIQASLASNSGFTNLTSSVTFSQSSYQEFCYTLASPARYIKISDNGNCAFRVDYVKYTTTGSGNNAVSYLWSGPGIVGANNGATVTVNMPGTYTVTVTDCNGCTDSDTVVVTGDDVPPVFDQQQSTYDLGCTESVPYIQPTATDNNGPVTYTYVDVETCNNNSQASCDFRTYTQGGWGAPAHGNNPGVYRNANFAGAFPSGLTIGCNPGNTLTLTSAQAVQDFLPSGSTPSALPSDLVNPGNSYNNVLAGQLVAVTLALGFDAYDPNFGGSTGFLGNQTIASGTFAGMTISQVVAIANQVIGGCSNAYTYSSLNEVLTGINENFDGGSNHGFVNCQQPDAACSCTHHRIWTAHDLCDNIATFDQYFITGDNEGPIPSVQPENTSVQCLDEVPAPPVVTFTDECGTVEETWMTEEVTPDGCGYVVTRIWMATDGCNVTYVYQVINVHDTTDPVFNNLPNNNSVECGTLPMSFDVTASDNCDNDLEVEMSYADQGEGCNLTRTFTFTVSDDCGNTATATRVYSVYDNEYPVLIGVPANTTLECDQLAPEAVVTAIDNCSENMIVSHSAGTDYNECGFVFTRTWSVTDDCGNTTTATQVINFVDTTDPIVTQGVPAELTIECDQDAPIYMPLFSDNCDDSLTVTAISGINNVNACGYDIERAWTATDDCDNSTTVYQIIHVRDTTDPILVGVPANTQVECDAVPAPAEVTATDNCSTATVSYSQTATTGCPYTITRTWTATDECGNQSTATQTIVVVDTTDPIVVSGPAIHLTIECGTTAELIAPQFDDNCDENLDVVFEEFEVSGGCVNGLIRRWTATDDCDNSTIFEQIISIIDTTDPVFDNLPQSTTVECDAVPAVPVVTASDICDSEVDVTFSETATEGCPYTITRTWTATDDCDNVTVGVQVITVVDTTYPVLYGVPASITLECDQIAPEAVVTASDNCTENLVVSHEAGTVYNECGFVFTRTWSVTDNCGNTTTATQVINFVDTTDPIVTQGVPAELTIECDQPEPIYMPSFADNCDDTLALSAISGINNVSACGYDIERAWTATDDCGNSTTVYQVIHVVDTTDPILVGVPANTEVECDAVPAPAEVTATDNCSTATVSYSQTATEGCPYTITRTWTATDECGNQSSASQTILVVDTTNPVLHGVPADAQVECSSIPAAAVVTATDNCDQDMEVGYYEQFIPGNDCYYTLVRHWEVTDDCDNTTSATQILYVTDTTDPSLVGVPANVTVECDEIPAPALVYGMDNCDQNVAVSFNETQSEGCPYTITRTWTGVDNCGNDVTATQIITVIDTTYPVLHGVPASTTLECDQIAPEAVVTATDNCSENLVVSLEAGTDYNECGFVFTRTWSVTDNCGNTTTATQVINFVDTTDPIVTQGVPAELTIECDQDAPFYMPSFSDNCDDTLAISAISGISNVNACGYDIERAWTATDDCDNSTTVYQIIHVRDTTDPILVGVPANTEVECDAVPAPANVTATDNCSTATVSYSQTATEGCPYTITRTWTATDECGNQSTASQTILVVDTTNPVLHGVPADAQVECSNIPAAAVVTATDNCDQDMEVGYYEQFIPGNDCYYTLVRHWEVTDDCDNTTSASQILYVTDTTDPSLVGVPANVTVECDEIPAPALVYGMDNCDQNVAVSFNETQSEGCPYTITRTWTGVDNCGNDVTATQIITVIDTTYPVLHGVPASTTLECDQIAPEAVVTATDNCSENLVVSLEAGTDYNECGFVFTRTWSVTDNCGNTTTATQVINFVDTTDPIVTQGVPAELTIECDQDAPFYMPSFSDNCDDTLAISAISGISNVNACGYDIERAWTATDDCDNSTTVYQIIHVRDTTDPILVGVPANTEVECDAVPAPANVTATDNCSTATVSYSQTATEGCPYTITRTWTATDECGNQSTASQTILVVDTTNPVLVGVPADAQVECSNIPAPAMVTATDNCDQDMEVGYYEQFIPGNDCYYTLVRHWTVSDDCDNTASASQTLYVTDTTDPSLVGVPANVTVECDEIPAPALVYGMDNCDQNVAVSFNETQSEGCPYTIIRTWTGVDNCGNDVSVSQIITVIDTTYPVLVGVPANTTLECDQIAPEAVVTATDNCSENLVVSLEAGTVYNECGYVFTRTWSVTDNCGNTTTATQVINFVDTTDPIVTEGVPAELTIECDQPTPFYMPSFSDNCDDSLDVNAISGIANVSDCGYDIQRAWTATDDCDNSTTVYQVIHVVDTTDPILVGVPANAEVECDEVPAPADVTATDNCTIPTVVMVETVTEGCPYTITRTWTATDVCGNETTATQVITVVDTQDPYLVNNPPVYYTIECGQEVPVNNPVFGDNCDTNLDVDFNEEWSSGGCPGTIIRTWVVTDNCGNSFEYTQYIGIHDTTAPVVVENVPAELTYECDQIIPEMNPSFADVCDDNFTVTPTVSIENETACGYDIVKTWTAMDYCENVTVVNQIIHVVDTTDPVIVSSPADLTLECGQEIPAPASIEAYDNCTEEVNIEFNADTTALECGFFIERTWTVSDDCGNSSVATQFIYVLDETAPVIFNIPGDITILCNEPIPAASDAVYATDNCDQDITVTVVEDIIPGSCYYQIKRYYNAIDACGNMTSLPQIITVTDTIAPVIEVPADLSVPCTQIPSAPELSAMDNCDDEVVVTYNEVVEEGCPYNIIRTWTATDDCGNTTVGTQIISVYDEENPVFDAYLPYVTVECDEVDAYMLTATDNCDAMVDVVIIEESQVSGQCYGSLLRTYLATDNCGNTATAFQIVDIVDSSAPVLNNLPAEEVTIVCGGDLPSVPEVTATDNCSEGLVVSFTETQTNDFCPYDVIRTWTVVDDCGNVTTATQTIHVIVDVPAIVHVLAYPNPAHGNFTLKMSVPVDTQVYGAIYDATGRELVPFYNGVAEGGRLYNWSMDARTFESGVYTIMVKAGNDVLHEKLVISNK